MLDYSVMLRDLRNSDKDLSTTLTQSSTAARYLKPITYPVIPDSHSQANATNPFSLQLPPSVNAPREGFTVAQQGIRGSGVANRRITRSVNPPKHGGLNICQPQQFKFLKYAESSS